MASEKSLVARPVGELEPRRSTLEKYLESVADEFTEIAEGMAHAFDEEKDIKRLSPRQQKAAKYALLPKNEVPFVLVATADFMKERLRMLAATKPSSRPYMTVEGDVVVMPPMQEPPKETEIVVIAEKTEAKG